MSTHNILFLNIKKKIILNYHKSTAMGFVPRDPRTSSKQPSVFESLKSRKENPQKPTQLSSRSHPRHLVGKRTAQKTPS